MSPNVSQHNIFAASKDFYRNAYVFTRLSLMWLTCGVLGWINEVFICGPLNGEEINLLHGGLGLPFLTIYAIGGVLIEAVFGLDRPAAHPVVQMLQTTLLCTALEAMAGLAMLYILGVQTWDYRVPGWNFLVSPHGLICLRSSLTYGLIGFLMLRYIPKLHINLFENHRTALFDICVIADALILIAILNTNVLHIIDFGGQWQ